jgi:hypothetical protein
MQNIFTTVDFHGTSIYEVVQLAERRYCARFLQYLPDVPLTPEKQKAADAAEAEYLAMCDAFGATPDDDLSVFGHYTTEQAARRVIELHDAISFAESDCHAFGAPSECVADATRGYADELDMLEREFGASSSSTNPYTERGVEDRTLTVAQSLGLPGGASPDDAYILGALGERPALH